jgi:hypothetical protein
MLADPDGAFYSPKLLATIAYPGEKPTKARKIAVAP